jgi:hypothetical protein
MQKPLLRLLTGAAIVISAGALSQPAGAIGLPGAQTMQGAVADSAITDKVHCRPGWWHHRFRPHDGCFGRYGYYGGYGYDYGYYGPGVGFYGPGVTLGFGGGPRFGFGHRRGRW